MIPDENGVPQAGPLKIGTAEFAYDYTAQTICGDIRPNAGLPVTIEPPHMCFRYIAGVVTQIGNQQAFAVSVTGAYVELHLHLDEMLKTYESNRFTCKSKQSLEVAKPL